MFEFLYRASIMLFLLSLSGYVLVVFKEKFFLKNNMIIIDNKYFKIDMLEETDTKDFMFRGQRVKSGDEVKIVLSEKNKNNKIVYKGILLGAKPKEHSIHLLSHDNELVVCKTEYIKKFKITSKYGKFFR